MSDCKKVIVKERAYTVWECPHCGRSGIDDGPELYQEDGRWYHRRCKGWLELPERAPAGLPESRQGDVMKFYLERAKREAGTGGGSSNGLGAVPNGRMRKRGRKAPLRRGEDTTGVAQGLALVGKAEALSRAIKDAGGV